MNDFIISYNKEFLKNPLSKEIWSEIVTSLGEYTNDSSIPRFFQPEEVVDHCKSAAASFAASLFTPFLTVEEVVDSSMYTVFLMGTIWGAQSYLKDRSLRKRKSPYHIEIQKDRIEGFRKKVFQDIANSLYLPDHIQEVFIHFISFFEDPSTYQKEVPQKHFRSQDYDTYLYWSFMWGFLFTKEVVVENKQQNKTDT